MSARAVDPAIVHARLRRMRELLDDLEALGTIDAGRLGRERETRYVVERVLTLLVELAVSINAHIAATRLNKSPADYRGSFADASAAGAIPEDLAQALAPSAGLRNTLIHEYLAIDVQRVAAAVPLALRDYRRYVQEIAGFILSFATHDDHPPAGGPEDKPGA